MLAVYILGTIVEADSTLDNDDEIMRKVNTYNAFRSPQTKPRSFERARRGLQEEVICDTDFPFLDAFPLD